VSQDTGRQSGTEGASAQAAVAGPWWAGHAGVLAVLITAQALYLCSMSVDLTLSGLVGYSLAPSSDLATLPFGLITVGSAVTTGFISALMARVGRKPGFLLGTSMATVGGLLSVAGIVNHSFILFCLGAFCVGVYQACAGYYRYAAADQVPPSFRARAISTVLTGGIVAAIAGPFIATLLMNATSHMYEGSYILVSVLSIMSMIVVSFFKDRSVAVAPEPASPAAEPAKAAEPSAKAAEPSGKLPWSAIARQPGFAVGAFAAAAGYIAMMIVMTVGPIAAQQYHIGPDQRSLMIQVHMVGMYAPALAAGFLIRKVGVRRLQLFGATTGIVGVIIGASGDSEANFILALGLVGVAWSLLYISGSTMIALSYKPKDKARTQAFGEALIMSGSAIGGLGAASLLTNLGWRDLNLLMLTLLVSAAVVTVTRRVRRPATGSALG
jgi:MFS family permease